MRKLLVKSAAPLFWAALLAASTSSSPADEGAKVDAYVRAEIERERIPGLALGVYRDGKIAKAEGYGIANLEWGVPVKTDTIFQSGSVGKQFAATAVMMLVEEGKVGLDDPVQKYFPDAPETWKGIKLRNLLSHTSGLGEQRFRNGCWLRWELSRFRAALKRFWPRDGWAG
jgi:CubicO group peptidase (beta-lactamase class C family)